MRRRLFPRRGRQAAADAQVDAGLGVLGVDPVHVIPLLVGDHLQGEFVVVAQKQGPLAVVGNLRGLLEDVDDGKAVFHAQGHEHAGHQGKVEGHVAFVPLAEVGRGVLGPLVGLGQEHAVAVFAVHDAAAAL